MREIDLPINAIVGRVARLREVDPPPQVNVQLQEYNSPFFQAYARDLLLQSMANQPSRVRSELVSPPEDVETLKRDIEIFAGFVGNRGEDPQNHFFSPGSKILTRGAIIMTTCPEDAEYKGMVYPRPKGEIFPVRLGIGHIYIAAQLFVKAEFGYGDEYLLELVALDENAQGTELVYSSAVRSLSEIVEEERIIAQGLISEFADAALAK